MLQESEIADLEKCKFPVVQRTVEEATAHFESQVLLAEELQNSLFSLDEVLQEGEGRLSREEGLLKELDADIHSLKEQLAQQQKENTIKDQTSKELYAYYETYSNIIQSVFGIQLEFIVPPFKLMNECSGIVHAIFEEKKDLLVAMYFSLNCSLVQVKVHILTCSYFLK